MSTSKLVPTTPPKLNGAYEDPDQLLIVGLDKFPKGLDPADYEQFADPERLTPPLEGLIESIMQHGVNDPITCHSVRATSGDRYRIVVNGRQRTMAAREANKRMKALGGDHFVAVPYVTKNDCDAATVVVSNEYRKADSVLTKAAKAARLIKWGKTKDQVRSCFAADDGKVISRQTLDNWLSLLKLPPAQQAEIESGKLGVSEGYEIARGTPVDAPNGKAPRIPRVASLKPTSKAIAALADKFAPVESEPLESEAEEVCSAVLCWVATGATEQLDRWPSIAEQVRKVLRPSFVRASEEM